MSIDLVSTLEEIRLLQKERALRLRFAGDLQVTLPCAYLRQRSPSAERCSEVDPSVNVIGITPVGRYAVRLAFDDGHETGIYSFEYLYQLGMEQP